MTDLPKINRELPEPVRLTVDEAEYGLAAISAFRTACPFAEALADIQITFGAIEPHTRLKLYMGILALALDPALAAEGAELYAQLLWVGSRKVIKRQ